MYAHIIMFVINGNEHLRAMNHKRHSVTVDPILSYRRTDKVTYTVSQKTPVASLKHNSGIKYWPIFKILSLLDAAINLQQYISNRTLSESLQYLVKYKR